MMEKNKKILEYKIEKGRSRIENLKHNLDYIYQESKQIKGLSKTLRILKEAIKNQELDIRRWERELKDLTNKKSMV